MAQDLDIEKLGRSSRQSALLSLAGLLIVLLSLAYSFYELNELREKKLQIELEIKRTNQDLNKQRTELQRVGDELARKQELLASVSLKLGTNNVAEAKQVLESAESGSTKTVARIFIHVRSREHLDKTAQIAQQLKAAGFNVPKAEILVDKGPKLTEVRYFHKTELEEAAGIARMLNKELKRSDVTAKYMPGYESSTLVKARQYEIWFGPESL